jgi:integrase
MREFFDEGFPPGEQIPRHMEVVLTAEPGPFGEVGRMTGPLTPAGIYQLVVRRGEQAGVAVHPQRFRHHFSHTWLDRGGAGGDLMQLNGWSSPQMLTWYGASAAGARARRNYDRIMNNPR